MKPIQTAAIDLNTADDAAIATWLRAQGLGLSVAEARRLRAQIGRDPSVVEARIFDTMWSEHCSYKSSRPVLSGLPTTGPEVILGPGEDAGVVHLGTHAGVRYCVVMAHESHNHPSQVMPVEGAATGIGGIVRDVFCMGAEVVGVLDALRFGDPHGTAAAVVRDIAGGVVKGIMDYGNALGVPNLGGDVYFDPSFDENCLVNVVAVGICREDGMVRSRVPAAAASGDEYLVILVGKPTDSTGFGGAAFASAVLDTDKADDQKGAVQVPDPFLKRVLFEATEAVLEFFRERSVEIGFKDLGAGGISCATVELAAAVGMGLEIDLDREAVDREDILPEVIACAETQERFALVVPAALAPAVLEIYNRDFELPALYPGAGARVVGRVLTDDRFVLRYRGEAVCDLPASVVTAGIAYERPQTPPPPAVATSFAADFQFDVGPTLRAMLGRPNLSSRGTIYHGYDSEVRGRALVRPGEGDAGVIVPVPGASFGLALAVDGIPAYGRIDPYLAGAHAACEAMRNLICGGAEPIGLTDCLNYGNPEDPEVFGAFVAGVEGISAAARGIGWRDDAAAAVPVVSGNVSFYNQSTSGRAVAPSPIVAAAGRLRDIAHATTMRVKQAGSELLLVGRRRPELGGSEFLRLLDAGLGGQLPPLDFACQRRMMYAVLDLIESGTVLACHDLSTGGLLVAVVEMLLGETDQCELGARLELGALRCGDDDAAGAPPLVPGVPYARLGALLFGETPGFVLELPAAAADGALAELRQAGVEAWRLGQVIDRPCLQLTGWGLEFDQDLAPLATIRGEELAAALA